MKNLFSFFVIVLFATFSGCSDKENSTSTQSIYTIPKVAEATLTPSANILRDTNPARRSNMIASTARQKKDINNTFPFDISLTNAKKEILNSEKSLMKNGKPTIVLFWLTTCYPCRMELNAIKKVYPDWKKEADFNLIAISTDFKKNYNNFIKRVEKEQWPWDTFHDTNREFRLVMPGALNGLPQTFIFDKNGEIAYHKRKYSTGDEIKLFEKVKELAAM
ncbi:MAG: redoxin domain-containing protein [Saprospiraceae bacterium]|nr:redoxin domain-containing protein [Saprospiraceae bacterium]